MYDRTLAHSTPSVLSHLSKHHALSVTLSRGQAPRTYSPPPAATVVAVYARPERAEKKGDALPWELTY